MRKPLCIAAALCACASIAAQQPQPPPKSPTNLGSDANGNPLRKALKTGHVSNYDESKVAPYTLPDPLVDAKGTRVRDRRAWTRRRAEIIKLYETHIYGRIPEFAPRVSWQVLDGEPDVRIEGATTKRIAGSIGGGVDGPRINLTLHTPANATAPVPVILMVNFGGGRPPQGAPAGRGRGPTAPAAAADILARGWGIATVGYADIQSDRANAWNEGVIGWTLPRNGQTQPAPDEWGTISAWAWGISRIIDYLENDRAVNARRIAVFGHSRLGKTVLWASALDERIAGVFSSCSGEMGASLARRDWGETVDDMAQNFAWQFAGNFQRWVGRWNEMPVDSHMLIALSAPRPVFITGGTADQWADPVGQFLATVTAGPVYRLLGRKDLGVTSLPPLDTPVINGDLGWHYHTGGHTATPADWQAFLQFMVKYW